MGATPVTWMTMSRRLRGRRWMRSVAVLAMAFLAPSLTHGQPVQPSLKPASDVAKPASSSSPSTSTVSTPPSSLAEPAKRDAESATDEFVKFSTHVREETTRQTDQLFRLLTIFAFILGALGVSGAAGLWLYAKKLLRQAIGRLEQQYNRTLEDRVNDEIRVFHDMFDKRQKKYSETLQTFFRKLFVAAPKDVQEAFLGIDVTQARSLEKKSILWVEDDPIGIALFVALAQHFGASVSICQSTEEALRYLRHGRDADLIVSNMNRRESEVEVRNAGLQLACALWKDFQKGTVIFTRPRHADRMKNDIQSATASGAQLEVVTDGGALFSILVSRLSHV